MTDFVAKAKVLAQNMLTYLVLAQTILVWVLANDLFGEWPQVVNVLVVIVTWIGAVILFIRKVTPVPKSERGLLPKQV